jgi:hypothetical protein
MAEFQGEGERLLYGSAQTLQPLPARLWIALAATLLAFGVEPVASLNLYILEDTSPLSRVADRSEQSFFHKPTVIQLPSP